MKRVPIKKKDRPLIQCAHCAHATLMQWDADPIISDCAFRGRNVAEVNRLCVHYTEATAPIKVTHLTNTQP